MQLSPVHSKLKTSIFCTRGTNRSYFYKT